MHSGLWSLARRTLQLADDATSDHGADRIVGVVTRFIDTVIANPGMQHWLADEGEHAMRLLTRREPDFQPRLIKAIEDLLTDETAAGRLDLPVELRELAYVIVRLIESYIYLDLITGEDPQTHNAEPILKMLLRSPRRLQPPAVAGPDLLGEQRHERLRVTNPGRRGFLCGRTLKRGAASRAARLAVRWRSWRG
jgi:hypothetical protein